MTDNSAQSQHGVCRSRLSRNDDDDDDEFWGVGSNVESAMNIHYLYEDSDELYEKDEEEEEDENINYNENPGPSTNSSPAVDSRKRTIHLDHTDRPMKKRRRRYMRVKDHRAKLFLRMGAWYAHHGSLSIEVFEQMINRIKAIDLTAAAFVDIMTYLTDDALSDPHLAVRYLRLALRWQYDERLNNDPEWLSHYRRGQSPNYLHQRIMRAWRSVQTHDFLSYLLPIIIQIVGQYCCDYTECNIHLHFFLMERHSMYVTFASLTLDRLSESDSLTEVEHRLTCKQFHHAMEAGATPIAVVLANFVSRATIESCAAAMRSRHELCVQPPFRDNNLIMKPISHSSRPYCRYHIIDEAVRFLLSLRCGIGTAADPTGQLNAILRTNKRVPDTLVLAAMRQHYIEYGIGPREPFSMPLVREARRALMIDVTDAYLTHLKKYCILEIFKLYY